MGITATLDTPFYFARSGGATQGVPDQFHVGIGGRAYMLNTKISNYSLTASNPNWTTTSISLLRSQADSSARPSEQSINPEDLWRRSAETWHAGAGQDWYDRDFSTDGRFRSSVGIDPWTRGTITLLNDTTRVRSSANTPLLAATQTLIYAADGAALIHAADGATITWTAVTPSAGTLGTINALATDGVTVWVCDDTDLYYTTNRGSPAVHYAPWHSSVAPASLVAYVKGRIITAGTNATSASLYNNSPTQGSSPPAAFFTHPNVDWTWVDITEGPNAIYFAGVCANKSLIYRTAVRADGTALDIPIVAGELPDGEIIRAIQGYLGFLLIGSNLGVRFATLDGSGNIQQIGDLIVIDSGVGCFAPHGRFVWFGWSDVDATHTGLGRIDLRTFNDTTPAYASDVQATTQGVPSSVVTFADRRWFAVEGDGIWMQEQDTKVPSGQILSGVIGYGLADLKTAVRVTTRHSTGAGTYSVAIALDSGAFDSLGTVSALTTTAGGALLEVGSQARAELSELRLTLTRDTNDVTSGPTVTRWTLRSDVGSSRRYQIVVPVMLHRTVTDRNGGEHAIEVDYERAILEALCETRQVVQFTEGRQTRAVVIDDTQWLPHAAESSPDSEIEGTLVVSMKTV